MSVPAAAQMAAVHGFGHACPVNSLWPVPAMNLRYIRHHQSSPTHICVTSSTYTAVPIHLCQCCLQHQGQLLQLLASSRLQAGPACQAGNLGSSLRTILTQLVGKGKRLQQHSTAQHTAGQHSINHGAQRSVVGTLVWGFGPLLAIPSTPPTAAAALSRLHQCLCPHQAAAVSKALFAQ